MYEEFGDKMAFNNFDLVIIAYFLTVVVDLTIKVLPWMLEWLKSVVSDIRKFMYDYAFFEFFINILIDLSNIKQILKKENTLSITLLILELFILLTAIWSVIVQLVEEDEEKKVIEIKMGKKGVKMEEGIGTTIQDSERINLKDLNLERLSSSPQKEKINSTKSIREKGKKLQKNLTSHDPDSDQKIKQKVNHSKTTPYPQVKQTISGEKKVREDLPQKKKKYREFNWLLKNSEGISDLRFMVIQVLIATVRGSNVFQFSLIIGIQVLLTILTILKLIFKDRKEIFIINFCFVFQEISISVFILTLVIIEADSNTMELIIIFSLSISLRIEFLIIVTEIVVSFISLSVSLYKKYRGKGKVKPGSRELLANQPNSSTIFPQNQIGKPQKHEERLEKVENVDLKRRKISSTEKNKLKLLLKREGEEFIIGGVNDTKEDRGKRKHKSRLRSMVQQPMKNNRKGKKNSYVRKTPLKFNVIVEDGKRAKKPNKKLKSQFSKGQDSTRADKPAQTDDVWDFGEE